MKDARSTASTPRECWVVVVVGVCGCFCVVDVVVSSLLLSFGILVVVLMELVVRFPASGTIFSIMQAEKNSSNSATTWTDDCTLPITR